MQFLKRYLIQIGLALIGVGFLYEVFNGGVPFQDPTIEMIKQHGQHTFIAFTLMQAGLALLIIGIMIKVFIRKKNKLY